jgi:hypothetical protein
MSKKGPIVSGGVSPRKTITAAKQGNDTEEENDHHDREPADRSVQTHQYVIPNVEVPGGGGGN